MPSVTMCGSLAQLVEQRPEEPCVPSSSLGGATKMYSNQRVLISVVLYLRTYLYFAILNFKHSFLNAPLQFGDPT